MITIVRNLMKLLIAEDESDLRDQYKEFLEQNNHQVITTKDGDECVTVFTSENKKWLSKKDDTDTDSPFDVVILDYQMPKKDGLEVAKDILSLVPKQRIIFASAYVENTLKDSIKNLKQIVETMQKPFSLQALADTIVDKEIYHELEKLNVDIKNLKELEPTHAQVRDYLYALKKIQKGRTF